MSENDKVMALVGELKGAVSGDEVGLVLKKLFQTVYPERSDELAAAASGVERVGAVSSGDHVILSVEKNRRFSTLHILTIEQAETLAAMLRLALHAVRRER